MHEVVVQGLNHARMVWQYRWLALISAIVLCMSGWVSVLLMPDRYEVSAKIFLDTRSLLRPLLKGLAVQNTSRQDAALMMRRTLLVRPNLEAVARKTDMDLKAKTPEDMEKLLFGLAENVKVTGTGKDNIFVIKYSNTDAKLATRVVEALLNLFVERSLGDTRKDTSKTKQFIEEQIKEYEGRLEAAEARLKEFKQRNVGMMPGEGGNYFSQRQQMAALLASAKLELNEATRRRESLRKQISGEEPSFGLGPQPPGATDTGSPLDARILGLEKNLDQLLLQYTDKHPDVISTRRVMDQLKKERAEEQKQFAATNPQGNYQLNQNPVYQELKISLGAIEAEVAALQARVSEYKKREVGLAKMVDTIPKVEAELARLNRDYNIDRKNYNELVSRREALKLGDDASQTTDDVQFNIIEPPREPLVPTEPDRPTLSGLVLLVGLGAGVGIAWLLAMLRPAIYSREAFAELTDFPVLGVVSRVWTPKEKVQRKMAVVSFAAGCLALIGVYAGLVTLQVMRVDIVSKVASLGERFL